MKVDTKKVAAIHDISGYGRASLTTVIPIISLMGTQVCPIPTAVLSTHTGGFGSPEIIDLTDNLQAYINHWKSLNLDFNCIYSGYLGSVHQINIISSFIKYFKKKDTLVVIDPVMGDDCELYSAIDYEMVHKMREFIKLAHVITPNYTEACYLLNKDCSKCKISEKEVKKMLISLSDIGPENVIITSVPLYDNIIATVSYNKANEEFYIAKTEKLNVNYPGTGDAFTSVIVGSLLKGEDIKTAVDKAVDFIKYGIEISLKYDYNQRDGILLEKALKKLI
ncbi:pyridoxamine kinase [Clostridium botulinum]|uniref:pyridoxal kinase n=1 Tax=Clostridium botulinum (strain Okra / Type B1) TaxID=498213 RepID=B1IKC2_CLOBK|nr:pyridoxamine kinase [Clostridium botulinum]ACA43496.1 pyridoxine kinase family protein [Clostridium botulinum B1 str. Okra]MBD5563279.1 pyridoxamine kinase [Clostridium botulinum]MBD5565907.1 pyridoxamine kinase [Clostridium botulinum]MBD5569575.1 pyridoxamine kinase [Clostridium botulinum]MBD5573629.1 pyridoxamine kinase [Clostridium botulinum]